MATRKKRTSLDALISPVDTGAARRPALASPARKSSKAKTEEKTASLNVAEAPAAKGEIVRQTLYLPLPVFDQLRDLFFEEQRGQVKWRRMHDYFLEGIDLLFRDRGLKSVEELTGRK
ncbi:MAG: hypothetical protein WBP93_14890 [Pyrinomonadaceae bacterium]